MISKALYTSNSDEWNTPQAFFDSLDAEFNFDLDAAASDDNHKCMLYYTKEQNGLKQEWGGIACGATLRIATLVSGSRRLSARLGMIRQLS